MQNYVGKGTVLELGLEIWSRRQWLAVVVFALMLAGTASVAAFLPNIYRSTATVLVERHQVPETFVRSSITGELETRLQTISHEMLSRARLEDLITRFGLYPEMRKRAPIEVVVEKMRRDVQFELKGVEQTSGRSATVAFSLSYRGRDPATVARVTNMLASLYVDQNSKIREQQASQTTRFLRGQLEETQKRLEAQEARVRDFRARHIGELPQQMAVNLATLERLQAQLQLNSSNQLHARDQRAALIKQLADTDAAETVGAPESTTTKLAKLKQELVALRTRYSDKYPDVIRVSAEIAALESLLGETSSTPSKTALSEVDAEMRSLKAEEERLRRAIDMYQRRVENAPQREQEFQALSRDSETTKELYSSLLKRFEDAQLAESMEQSQQSGQFRILDPAIPAKEPQAPNRIGLILAGVLLAVGTAAAAAMLAERLDTSFHTFEDLRSFAKVPVLASIPHVPSADETARLARRHRLATASITLGLALVVAASYYLAHGNDELVRLLSRGGS
ncbi:MAG: hypothetical protein DMD88_00135 [Candidatus Rokuibacteriota bacterium]|nr:MAG: hypothetical protein DMD88_00135 [Candidatus Rokubacteria bacterium]